MATHPDLVADERTTLEQFLDQQRDLVVERVAGLDDAQARSHPLPATDLTVIGLVNHLAHVEDNWVQGRLVGVEVEPWASAPWDDDIDWEFHTAVELTLAEVVGRYRDACERSRTSMATFDLDTLAVRPSFGKGPVSVRWVFVHLIEETACHLGHLDLLCDALAAERSRT